MALSRMNWRLAGQPPVRRCRHQVGVRMWKAIFGGKKENGGAPAGRRTWVAITSLPAKIAHITGGARVQALPDCHGTE